MKTTSKLIALTLVLSAGLTLGCRKSEVDKDTQSSVDYSVAEAGYGGVLPVMNQIGIEEDGLNKSNSTCATITWLNPNDTVGINNWPITIELDYGTTGCLDYDGKFKQGKVIASFHDKFSNTGAMVDITLVDYYVNSTEYQGTLTLKNDGNNTYSSTVHDGKCVGSDWTIEYGGTSTITWLTGSGTPADATDDSFEYHNSSTCKNREGRSFTVLTTVPLLKTNNCEYIAKGVVEITPEELATRTIDYGDGSCDDEASVSVNGNTFVFKLN